MVSEDRQLRLRGYEVYRFGGHELSDSAAGAVLLRDFFTRLADRHPSYTPADAPSADPPF